MAEYKQIFNEFLEEAISSEFRRRYGPAVSNYYKALTALCSYLITTKLRKAPKSHTEIFLFLRVSFPDIYEIADGVFTVYTNSYDHLMKQEDCSRIKDAIRQITHIGGIEEEFKEYLKKI